MLALAAVVWLACRRDRAVSLGVEAGRGWRVGDVLLPVAGGLFLATKQYLVLAAPLVWLLLPRRVRLRGPLAFAAIAAAAAAIVTLPLVAPDAAAFWRSTVTVQLLAPYRTDALTFHNYWLHLRGMLPADGSLPPAEAVPPGWPALLAAGAALGLALWRGERSAAGFAGSVALVFLPFISLNKQAFANYYYFVIAALCCAAAAAAREAASDTGGANGAGEGGKAGLSCRRGTSDNA